MFHTVVLDPANPAQPLGFWDAITTWLLPNTTNQYAVSDSVPPPGITKDRWCRRLSWTRELTNPGIPTTHADGTPLTDAEKGAWAGYFLSQDIIAILDTGWVDDQGHPGQKPAYVMVDEMQAGYGSRNWWVTYYVAWFLSANRPDLNGKWGFYMPLGAYYSYNDMFPTIQYCLQSNAILAFELYVAIGAYRGRQAYGNAYADEWLKEWLIGSGTLETSVQYAGFGWVDMYRTYYNSSSRMVPIFGVGDAYLEAAQCDAAGTKMLERAIWAFKVSGASYTPDPGYGNYAKQSANGGGSWKWDPYDSTYGTLSLSRDSSFTDSWFYYLGDSNWTAHVTPRYSVPHLSNGC